MKITEAMSYSRALKVDLLAAIRDSGYEVGEESYVYMVKIETPSDGIYSFYWEIAEKFYTHSDFIDDNVGIGFYVLKQWNWGDFR